MALAIRLDDITHMHCDAIVTATDTALSGTCGVDQDIHRAAGPELDAACRALAPCPVASAVCTDGYRLSRKIIHAVGPTWHGDSDDLQTLAACYRAVFACAREARCASLAMPLISAGHLGFPPDDVLRIAVQEARCDVIDAENEVRRLQRENQALRQQIDALTAQLQALQT